MSVRSLGIHSIYKFNVSHSGCESIQPTLVVAGSSPLSISSTPGGMVLEGKVIACTAFPSQAGLISRYWLTPGLVSTKFVTVAPLDSSL